MHGVMISVVFNGERYPGFARTKSAPRTISPPAAGTKSSLREDLDCLTLLIIKASQHDTDNIQNLPDEEAAAGEELDNAGNDLSGVDAVYTAEAAENQQAEEEGDETGTGGLITGAVRTAAHGVLCMGFWGLKKFFGAGQQGIARVG